MQANPFLHFSEFFAVFAVRVGAIRHSMRLFVELGRWLTSQAVPPSVANSDGLTGRNRKMFNIAHL